MGEEALRLGYAVILCSDLGEMRTFYVDVLGLSVLEERPDFVKLAAGSVFVALRARNRSYDPGEKGASTQLAFPVLRAELDGWHRRLRAAGVSVVEPPTDQDWGHRTLFGADPEGNLVEFYAEL